MKSLVNVLASLLFACSVASAHAEEKVVIYNWTEYIPEGVLDDFTKETGIKVDYNTYDSNELMYSKIKIQDGKGYDVIVPSTYLVSKMAKEDMLAPLDKAKLSNFKHLDESLLSKPYDPDNTYSVPYTWGSTGIGINTSEISDKITAWKDLWNPKWKGKLLLTNDMREVFQMALRINGHSANTTNPEEIKQAYERLKLLMPNVLAYNSDAPREPYLAGDVNLGMIWNGEVIMAQAEEPNINYIYPEEGGIFWVDSFAIPKGAANKDNAHKFIDFMLRPETAKRTVEALGYATPNKTALPLLDKTLRENSIIFPPKETIDKGEFQKDVGDEALKVYKRYWEILKTQGH